MSLSFQKRRANLIRIALNDLKRDVATAAQETGLSQDEFDAVLDPLQSVGETELLRLVLALARTYPLSPRDLLPIVDDAPDGVVTMRRDASLATSRKFTRADVEYYEYFDTAMSRGAMFRPEYLRMLVAVDNDDPEKPSVRWNNGHFLFQLTYFIGEVNYYHECQGQRFCFQMQDGDAAIGMPYCPHSFTSRRADGENAILALTFGGRLLGDPQQELSLLGAETAGKYVLPNRSTAESIAQRIAYYRERLSMPLEILARASGVLIDRLTAICGADSEPNGSELHQIATALRVRPSNLSPTPSLESSLPGVLLSRKAESRRWMVPDEHAASYQIRELVSTAVIQGVVGLEVTVLHSPEAAGCSTKLQTGLHGYGYLIGEHPVLMEWESNGRRHVETLSPGDSFYCKPFVAHSFRRTNSNPAEGDCRIILLRIPGKIGPDQLTEASSVGCAAIERLLTDTTQWFSR